MGARIQRFEDVEAWQKARELSRHVYRVSGAGVFARDHNLVSQIRRAAISTMSNIAEGFERRSDKEFLHFLGVARGSAAEVRSLLYLAHDVGLLADAEFEELCRVTAETTRLISGLMRYLKTAKSKGRAPDQETVDRRP